MEEVRYKTSPHCQSWMLTAITDGWTDRQKEVRIVNMVIYGLLTFYLMLVGVNVLAYV